MSPDNAILRNCLTSGPLTLDNGANHAYLGGNAMFGTVDRLKKPDRMPGFTDAGGTYPAKPYYLGSDDVFAESGIWTKSEGEGNIRAANWHVPAGEVPGDLESVPLTLWGAGLIVLERPTGDLDVDCAIPALRRLGPLDSSSSTGKRAASTDPDPERHELIANPGQELEAPSPPVGPEPARQDLQSERERSRRPPRRRPGESSSLPI